MGTTGIVFWCLVRPQFGQWITRLASCSLFRDQNDLAVIFVTCLTSLFQVRLWFSTRQRCDFILGRAFGKTTQVELGVYFDFR